MKQLYALLLLSGTWLGGAEMAQAEDIPVKATQTLSNIVATGIADASKDVMIYNGYDTDVFVAAASNLETVAKERKDLTHRTTYRIISASEPDIYRIYSVQAQKYLACTATAEGDNCVSLNAIGTGDDTKWKIVNNGNAADGRYDLIPYGARGVTNNTPSLNMHSGFREGDQLGLWRTSDNASVWQFIKDETVNVPSRVTLKNTARGTRYASFDFTNGITATTTTVGHREVFELKTTATAGVVRLYSPYLQRYVAPDGAESAAYTLVKQENGAGLFRLQKVDGKIIFVSTHQINAALHVAGAGQGYNIVRWYADANVGSQFEMAAAPDWAASWAPAYRSDIEKYSPVGTGLGQYTASDPAAYEAARAQAEGSTDENPLKNYFAALDAMTFTLNLPQNGQFLRIKSNNGAKLVSRVLSGDRLGVVDAADENTIFCFSDGKLVSLKDGKHVGLNATVNGHYATVDYGNAGVGVAFSANPHAARRYLVVANGNRHLFVAPSGATQVNAGGSYDNNEGYKLQLEAVTSLPLATSVTIDGTAYGTFYTPVAGTLAGTDAQAYTATVDAARHTVLLRPIEGNQIPAGTAFVFKGTGLTFEVGANSAAIAEGVNQLRGYAASTNRSTGSDWGLSKTASAFAVVPNNTVKRAFRGFFENVSAASGVQAFSLRLDNLTGVESVVVEGEQDAPVFDLSGRRVRHAVKGGLYIRNGKKIIF